MARPFRDLVDKMTPESRARAEAKKRALREQFTLREVRRTREFTQQGLAEALNVSQASVSKMEGQADMYVSTLRRIVEALGGELELIARFPDEEVRIDFDETGAVTSPGRKRVKR